MKAIRSVLIGCLLFGIIACGAQATPIEDISATVVHTSYDADLQILTLSEVRPIEVGYVGIPGVTAISDVEYSLTTHLISDMSLMFGFAYGNFAGGSISLTADSGNGDVLLSATIDSVTVMAGGSDLIAVGSFSDVTGTWADDWFDDQGKIYDLIWFEDPPGIDDFSQSFAGGSNITIQPVQPGTHEVIPEPLTIAVLGIGLAGIAVRRRKQR